MLANAQLAHLLCNLSKGAGLLPRRDTLEALMADKNTQIKMLHPDHKTRDDGGIYFAESEAEAMQLGTRGYIRADGDDSPSSGKKPPAQGGRTANAAGGSAPADT